LSEAFSLIERGGAGGVAGIDIQGDSGNALILESSKGAAQEGRGNAPAAPLGADDERVDVGIVPRGHSDIDRAHELARFFVRDTREVPTKIATPGELSPRRSIKVGAVVKAPVPVFSQRVVVDLVTARDPHSVGHQDLKTVLRDGPVQLAPSALFLEAEVAGEAVRRRSFRSGDFRRARPALPVLECPVDLPRHECSPDAAALEVGVHLPGKKRCGRSVHGGGGEDQSVAGPAREALPHVSQKGYDTFGLSCPFFLPAAS
jgi:hypothetical protein